MSIPIKAYMIGNTCIVVYYIILYCIWMVPATRGVYNVLEKQKKGSYTILHSKYVNIILKNNIKMRDFVNEKVK